MVNDSPDISDVKRSWHYLRPVTTVEQLETKSVILETSSIEKGEPTDYFDAKEMNGDDIAWGNLWN